MQSLLERDDQLRQIAGLLERASAGRGGVLVVEGPAGIGKTELLRHAVAGAAGFGVAQARGGELERHFHRDHGSRRSGRDCSCQEEGRCVAVVLVPFAVRSRSGTAR